MREVEVGLSTTKAENDEVFAIFDDAQLLKLFELIKFDVDDINELF